MRLFSLTLLAFATIATSAPAQIRLTTPALSFTAIAGVENYAAIIVEGATAGSQAVWMHSGPGMVQFDKESHRWLWSWQPSIADTAKEHVVVVRAAAATNQCRFVVRPRAFKNDARLQDMSKGRFYSGIPTNINAKQPGLDGAYSMTLTLDDSIAIAVNEPNLTIRPHILKEVGKQAQLTVEYTAPMTGKPVTIATYQTKVKYPPFRVPGSMEWIVGEEINFRAALGLPPNFYTTVPSFFLVVKSDGYLEDTARIIGGGSHEENDPFSMFSTNPPRGAKPVKTNSFDFRVRQTDKAKSITDPKGKIILVELFDPVTDQRSSMEILLFPPSSQAPTEH